MSLPSLLLPVKTPKATNSQPRVNSTQLMSTSHSIPSSLISSISLHRFFAAVLRSAILLFPDFALPSGKVLSLLQSSSLCSHLSVKHSSLSTARLFLLCSVSQHPVLSSLLHCSHLCSHSHVPCMSYMKASQALHLMPSQCTHSSPVSLHQPSKHRKQAKTRRRTHTSCKVSKLPALRTTVPNSLLKLSTNISQTCMQS